MHPQNFRAITISGGITMSIFFTADLHLGDKEYLSTELFDPFSFEEYAQEKRDKQIIDNINATVNKDDTLYILGDFASQNTKKYRNQINCLNVHLVPGEIDKDYEDVFISSNSFVEIQYKGKTFQLCHYPICPSNFRSVHDIWLHGHSHVWKDENVEICDEQLETIYDVGLNANNNKPVSIDEILDFYDKNGTKEGTDYEYKIIQLGKFNDSPIDWLVLHEDKDNNKFLISKQVLDFKPYHTNDKSVSWNNCELRKWLNTEFVNTAFSQKERQLIKTTTNYPLRTKENSSLDIGLPSEDKVFLLDNYEVSNYFKRNSHRRGYSGIDFEIPPKQFAEDIIKKDQPVWYWLRTAGNTTKSACAINYMGQIEEDFIDAKGVGVRPAMWIHD